MYLIEALPGEHLKSGGGHVYDQHYASPDNFLAQTELFLIFVCI